MKQWNTINLLLEHTIPRNGDRSGTLRSCFLWQWTLITFPSSLQSHTVPDGQNAPINGRVVSSRYTTIANKESIVLEEL